MAQWHAIIAIRTERVHPNSAIEKLAYDGSAKAAGGSDDQRCRLHVLLLRKNRCTVSRITTSNPTCGLGEENWLVYATRSPGGSMKLGSTPY